MLLAVYQPVLQHFGIAGEHVLCVKRMEERGVEYDAVGIAEDAYLIFQSAEVDARLAAH